MRLGGIAVLAALLGATSVAAPSQALPVTYELSMRVTSVPAFATDLANAIASEHGYVVSNPGSATPGWNGTLSYDADTGSFSVSLVAPFGDVLHPIDLGGMTVANLVGDQDALQVDFASAQPYPRYFSRLGDYSDVFSWGESSTLVLASPGLVTDGELRHGLTVGDLGSGYLLGSGAPFDAPALMYTYGCPTTLNLVECAYAGYYHYQDDGQYLLLTIADLHEIPEASVSPYFALALALLAAARRFAV